MTYGAGQLIEDVDYNGFANNNVGANVNSIWSTGVGDAGYGQSALATVADGTLITATQWANLNNRITSLANHTGTTITSRSNPVVGDLIGILSALNTDLTNCTSNRGNAVFSGPTTSSWSGNISKTTNTGSGQSAWSITFTHTVTFPSADQARYFFNAGGLIRLDMSKTSIGTDSDPDWNTLSGNVGALLLSGRVNGSSQLIAGTNYTGFTRIGGSGVPSTFASTTGWYSLASGAAATTMFQLDDGGAYAGNFIRVTAAVNSARTVLTFVTTWFDAGASGFGTSANITGGSNTGSPFSGFGTAPTVLCRAVEPSPAFLSNTWGTVAIAGSVA